MGRIHSGPDSRQSRAEHARRNSLANPTPALPGAQLPAAQRARATPGQDSGRSREPLQAVTAQRMDGEATHEVRETLAAEVPVAMQYNARPHAVMMATPSHLDDFALGVALTERIIASVSELTLADTLWTEHGVALEMLIPQHRFLLLQTRERNLTGRPGCGLCGTATLEAAIRPVRRVEPRGARGDVEALRGGARRLTRVQPCSGARGAVPAAAVRPTAAGSTVGAPADRHNAINK